MKKKEVLKLASTRAIVSTVRHIEMGKSLDWSLDVFFSDWTQDEMAKVRDWGNKRLKEIKTALQPPKPKKVEEGDPEPAEEMDVENHDKDLPF